jgi:hypothetical protein
MRIWVKEFNYGEMGKEKWWTEFEKKIEED